MTSKVLNGEFFRLSTLTTLLLLAIAPVGKKGMLRNTLLQILQEIAEKLWGKKPKIL